ncbi:MAG TPA: aldehyde dehydrogenase family protein, partial [Terriglobales bacterium]
MTTKTASPRTLTESERAAADVLLQRARQALAAAEALDQAAADRICRGVAWAIGNETTATRLAHMSVDESGMGSREPSRRFKVHGVLRDALRQRSLGVIEEIPERGLVKYAKPAGVIASLVPVTSPYITPATTAIYALKCRNAVIFCPHPASRRTSFETVRLMRAV